MDGQVQEGNQDHQEHQVLEVNQALKVLVEKLDHKVHLALLVLLA